jgi:hypothetical protein
LVNWKATTNTVTGSNPTVIYAGQATDGDVYASRITTWYESGGFSDESGTWTSRSDASASNNEYWECTANGVARATITGLTAVQKLLLIPRRVFGRFRSITSEASVKLTVSLLNSSGNLIGNGTLMESDVIEVATHASTGWFYIDFGLLNATGLIPTSVPAATTAPKLRIDVTVSGISGNELEFDNLEFIPVPLMVHPLKAGVVADEVTWISGPAGAVIEEGVGIYERSRGLPGTVPPGKTMSRTLFMAAYRNDESYLTYLQDQWDFEVEVLPRTRHLLGTI